MACISGCGKSILRPSDITPDPDVTALPQLPKDADGPAFSEPWQASAFALALSLSRQGHFSWAEWAETLSQELRASAARGEANDGTLYYHCWLAALERLIVAKHLSDASTLHAQKEAWADAYRRTPHGEPVTLVDESSSSLVVDKR